MHVAWDKFVLIFFSNKFLNISCWHEHSFVKLNVKLDIPFINQIKIRHMMIPWYMTDGWAWGGSPGNKFRQFENFADYFGRLSNETAVLHSYHVKLSEVLENTGFTRIKKPIKLMGAGLLTRWFKEKSIFLSYDQELKSKSIVYFFLKFLSIM